MKHILITGKSGYIARSLLYALQSKYIITSIGRDDFDLTNAGETRKWFKDKHFDAIIHTAISGGSRFKVDDICTLDTNIRMFLNLYDQVDKFDRFINFGSGAEDLTDPGYYGLSKRVIREYILSNPKFYSLKIYAVFDENELSTRFIKSNIINYINKNPIIIHQNKYMDFFFMGDLVKLVDYQINTRKMGTKIIDCVYGDTNTLLDIANNINQLAAYRVDIITQSPIFGESYVSNKYSKLPIHCKGLQVGIQNTYNALLNEK